MKGRSLLLALFTLAFALSCENSEPTGPRVPNGLSKSVSDGAHGDNRDFFFLPPLFKLKKQDPNFELGKFNATLQPTLKVVICELVAETPSAQNPLALPKDGTACGATVKTFGPGNGDVQQVDLPARRREIPKEFHVDVWWKGPHGPTDGFYYVLWDTQQPGLSLNKFYRIKVFNVGTSSDLLLGFADVDPRAKGGPKWKYSRTGDVIEMVDKVKLPIPFRVETGALCTTENCTQVTVPNDNPNGDFTVVTIDNGGGSIAGARFPDGWLPEGGPQSVVVTITELPSQESDDGSRTRTTPCHVGLPFQQFNMCFTYTTTPELDTDENGDQFARDVTVAVCYALEGTGDEREKFAQLYASDVGEPPRALPEVSDQGILGAGARDCTASEVSGLESSNPLTRLANTGWRKVKGGLSQLFGVKTAYAVDKGLGGIVKGFSNIGPALTAEIEAFPQAVPEPAITPLTLEDGKATARVRIVGSHSHAPDPSQGAPDGINDVPVTFTIVGASGNISRVDANEDLTQITLSTSTFFTPSASEDAGIASVIWTPPTVAGVYTLKATGPTRDTVTFTATVDSGETGAEFPIANSAANEMFGGTARGAINYLVAVQGTNAAGQSTVGAQLVAPTGVLVGSPILVPGRVGDPARIAFDGERYLMVWGDHTGQGADFEKPIFGQFVSGSGALSGNPFTIANGTTSDGGVVGIAFSGGTYFVAYALGTGAPGTGTFTTYGRLVSTAGELGPELTLSTATKQGFNGVASGTGGFLTVYTHGPSAKGRFVSTTGIPGAEFTIHTVSESDALEPLTTATYNGTNYLVTFAHRVGERRTTDAYAQLVTPAGGLLGGRITIAADPESDETAIGAVRNGSTFLVSYLNDFSVVGGASVRARFVSSAGAPSSSAITLATSQSGKSPVGGVVDFSGTKYFLVIMRGVPNATEPDVLELWTQTDLHGAFLTIPLP